jgi:glycosyltransferase involved in cell wall biosynthesis
MRILLSAYACRANAGSEPAQGWGWATHLAGRGHEVHVLVAKRNQESVEAGLREEALPNLRFSYVPVRYDWAKRWEGLHYALWQAAALKAARELCSEVRFDVVHHVTYASIHVPSQLWRLGIPMVFGPVGGGQTAPADMLSYFGADQQKERLRTALTRALTASPLHRFCLARTGFVLAANSETLNLVRRMGCDRATVMCDTAVPNEYFAESPRTFPDKQRLLRLIWVGRMLPRKALSLALDVVREVKADVTLTIAGDGMDPQIVRQMIISRNLQHRVFWEGRRLSWSELRTAYSEHDAMLFTSLRDSFGSQVLEALAMALPVIALDLSGVRDHVPANASMKVRVSSSEATVRALADAIERFALLPGRVKSEMSKHALNFAQGMSWSARIEVVEKLYERLCARAAPLERTSRSRLAAAKT